MGPLDAIEWLRISISRLARPPEVSHLNGRRLENLRDFRDFPNEMTEANLTNNAIPCSNNVRASLGYNKVIPVSVAVQAYQILPGLPSKTNCQIVTLINRTLN